MAAEGLRSFGNCLFLEHRKIAESNAVKGGLDGLLENWSPDPKFDYRNSQGLGLASQRFKSGGLVICYKPSPLP